MPTPQPKHPLLGLVLAGGYSTRMGRDKGAIQRAGKPQAQRAFDLLREHCDDAFVSIRSEQSHNEPYSTLPCIADRFRGFGPLGGVLTAMVTHPGAAWLVLACDMPKVDAATIETLLAACDPSRVATCFAASDGRPEPLCAVYERESVDLLRERMTAGDASLRRMLSANRIAMIEPPDADALLRANRPGDEAKIAAKQTPS